MNSGSPEQNIPLDKCSRFDWRAAFELFGPLVALIAMVVVSAILSPSFLKPGNILDLLHDASFIGIVSLGMTLVIISGGIDLSVGSLLAFAGTLGLWVLNTSMQAASIISHANDAIRYHIAAPDSAIRVELAKIFISLHLTSELAAVAIAIVTILLVAALSGLFNGTLIAYGRIAPFIATLATMAMFRSLAQTLVQGSELTSASKTLFPNLGSGGVGLFGWKVDQGVSLILSYPVIIFAVLAILMHVILNRTRYGRYVFAIGCNERSAVYSAINVNRVKLITYTIAGFLSGVAALLFASRFNSIDSSSSGNLFELDAIAAVVIGGTRIQGGSGSIWGTVVGVLLLVIISNMMHLLDVNQYPQGCVKGVIIIAAVLLQQAGRKSQ